MFADLRERIAVFGLMLHEDKTRLIDFSRLSAERRQARGDRRPETFTLLGSRITARGAETAVSW
jgi:RNA-directed DNA polymerase